MSHNNDADEGPSLVSVRTMEIAVAFLFLAICAVVIADCLRLGIRWLPNEGPAPGFYPFYVSVLMAFASIMNLIKAWPKSGEGAESFVSVVGFKRMAAIFVPAVAFVFATHFIGIYVASAIYIGGFMVFVGKYPISKAVAVSVGFAAVTFWLFEDRFLVPLPKGPLEAMLGY